MLGALMELVPGDMGMAFMDTIVEGLPRIQQKNNSTPIKAVDLTPVTDVLSDPKTENYAYVGSLTQPPCSEGVFWVVSHQTFPITVQQFNALKGVLKFNSRYTQNTLGDGNLLQIAKGNNTHS